MYRSVSMRWRLMMQLATLLATALVGLSIALTPPSARPQQLKLTAFEHAMSSLSPAITLIFCGTVGFVCEVAMSRLGVRRYLFVIVSLCHATCFGLYMALSASSLIGLIRNGQWYAFGAPVLGILLAFLNLMYLQRRKDFPTDVRKFR